MLWRATDRQCRPNWPESAAAPADLLLFEEPQIPAGPFASSPSACRGRGSPEVLGSLQDTGPAKLAGKKPKHWDGKGQSKSQLWKATEARVMNIQRLGSLSEGNICLWASMSASVWSILFHAPIAGREHKDTGLKNSHNEDIAAFSSCIQPHLSRRSCSTVCVLVKAL